MDQKIHWIFGVLGGCHPYPYVNHFTSSWSHKCSSMMRDICDISGSVRIQIFIHFHPADLKICLGESTEYVGLLPYLLSIWSPHPEAANAASWCGIVITSLNLVRFKDLNVFIQQIRRSDWVKTMNIWDSPPSIHRLITSSTSCKRNSLMRNHCKISVFTRIQRFDHFYTADLKICLYNCSLLVSIYTRLLGQSSPHPGAENSAPW